MTLYNPYLPVTLTVESAAEYHPFVSSFLTDEAIKMKLVVHCEHFIGYINFSFDALNITDKEFVVCNLPLPPRTCTK